MIKYTVANRTNDRTKLVTRKELEVLRMQADWQLRQLGYDPTSVNSACREADNDDAIIRINREMYRDSETEEEEAEENRMAGLMERERAYLCSRLGR